MTDYTQEQLADELDQLAVEVGHEAVAENTAAMHEALAIGRVATGVTSPNVLTWLAGRVGAGHDLPRPQIPLRQLR